MNTISQMESLIFISQIRSEWNELKYIPKLPPSVGRHLFLKYVEVCFTPGYKETALDSHWLQLLSLLHHLIISVDRVYVLQANATKYRGVLEVWSQ